MQLKFALLLGGQCLLLVGAVLRENPVFWLHSGGYPLWLRLVVQAGFYPALMLLLGAQLSCPPRLRDPLGAWLLWAASAWVMVVSVIWFSWNNLENLLAGRGLHDH